MNTLFMHRVTNFEVKPRTIHGATGPVHFVDIVVEGETPFTITLFSTQPLDLNNVIQPQSN